MLDREQAALAPPFGRALDLGCGSGIWTVELAKRGWEVTGIDVIAKAVRGAEERASEADVDARFVEGDVAALRAAGVGTGFRLALDFGTVHGLSPDQREALGRELNAVCTEDAVLLMYATAPGRRGPLPAGMSRADVEAAYPGWKLTGVEAFDASGAPGSFQRARPRWYRLERR